MTHPEYTHPMQRDVALFHRAFGLPDLIEDPGVLPQDRIDLRVSLVHEEGIVELREAVDVLASGSNNSPVPAIDALIDTMYVSLGGLVEMGCNVMDQPEAMLTLPPRPGLVMCRAAVAATYAIEKNLQALESKLHDEDREESMRLFSAVFNDARTALLWAGFDPEPFFAEVQRANMSKLGADGRPVHSRGFELDGYPEGKVLKGSNYSPPDLEKVYSAFIAAKPLHGKPVSLTSTNKERGHETCQSTRPGPTAPVCASPVKPGKQCRNARARKEYVQRFTELAVKKA